MLYACKGYAYLEALSLDPGEKWRQERLSRPHQESLDLTHTITYPHYDPRVDEYSWDAVPCKVLRCPNLDSEDPYVLLNWLDLSRSVKLATKSESKEAQ